MKLLTMFYRRIPMARLVLLSFWAILAFSLIIPAASADRLPSVHDRTVLAVADVDGNGSPEILYRNSIGPTTALWLPDEIPISTASLVSSPAYLLPDHSIDDNVDTGWGATWWYFTTSSGYRPRLALRPIDSFTVSSIQIRAPPQTET